MPNIRFYIDQNKCNKQGFSPIYANISFKNENYKRIIEQVKKRYWSTIKQQVNKSKETEPYNRHVEINTLIDDYRSKAKSLFNDCLIKDIPITQKLVTDFLKGNIRPIGNNEEIESVFLKFIESCTPNVSKNTLKKYNNTLQFLTSYQVYSKEKIKFSDIVTGFDDKLKQYSAIEKKHRANTYFAYLSVLKQFLRWAKIRKYYNGTDHQNFKAESKDITFITLEFEELKKLYYFEFENPMHNWARDIFCFGCLTGLRRGDIMTLRRDHIQGRFIYVKPQKSAAYKKDVTLTIPIVDAAQRIIDKNPDSIVLFRHFSNVTFLKNLEKCCEKVGIDTITEKVNVLSNNADVRESGKKSEFITGHTSRKTFMTLSYKLGVRDEIITSITGHTDGRKIIRKYMEIDKEVKFLEMQKAWKVLYQAPGTEDPELTETEKLKREIEELKKIIASSIPGATSSRVE